jgi:ribosome modulation factor
MERIWTSGGKAFADGYRAGRTGKSYTSNPYGTGSACAAAWLDGWNEGSTRRAWIKINETIGASRDGGSSAADGAT